MGLIGCQEQTLLVEHYKTPCWGLELGGCLLTQEAGGPQQLEYDGIVGFNYQWGHRYLIRVRVQHVANPPADGSSEEKSLIEILSDESVPEGTPFSISLQGPDDFAAVQKTNSQYVLFNERAVACAPAVCQMLDDAPKGTGNIVLELHHPASPEVPLQLVQVR